MKQSEFSVSQAQHYFPRNQLDEATLWQVARGTTSVTEISERTTFDHQIRIIRNPQHTIMMLGSELK